MGELAIAEALGWPLEDLRASFKELEQTGMATADWEAPLVFLPFVIHDNKPENPNVVLGGWRPAFDELPDSNLKPVILTHFREYLQTLHPGFLKAYREAFPEAFTKGLPEALPQGPDKPSPKQEQEQEQASQEQEQEPKTPEQELQREEPVLKFPADSKPARADARADVSFDEFAEMFKARRAIKYRHTTGDFVQLAALRKSLDIETKAEIPDWQLAVENYLNTPQGKYTLSDLCSRFDVFRLSALDRFKQPTRFAGHGLKVNYRNRNEAPGSTSERRDSRGRPIYIPKQR